MRDVARAGHARQRHQRRERHHLAALRARPQPRYVLGLRAQVALRLGIHAEQTTEAVEVVDVEAAHEDAERLEDVVHRHAEGLGLRAIEVDEHLRHAGPEGGEEVAQLGRLVAGLDHALRHRRELLDVAAAPVLELELEAAGAREPADRRRVQRDHARALRSLRAAVAPSRRSLRATDRDPARPTARASRTSSRRWRERFR